MSQQRAVRMALLGAVLVGGALWLSPPQPLVDWLSAGDEPNPPAGPETAGTGTDAPASDVTPINPLSQLKPDQFAELVDRPLFNPGRAARPVAPEPQPEPDPQPDVTETEPPPAITAADFNLLAVAGAEPNLTAVVRWLKTNTVYHVRQGQYVGDIEVASVSQRGAILRKDDQQVELALFRGTVAADATESGDSGASTDDAASDGDQAGTDDSAGTDDGSSADDSGAGIDDQSEDSSDGDIAPDDTGSGDGQPDAGTDDGSDAGDGSGSAGQ